ncbi:MAG: hypothetical protein JWQ99_4024 [Blastococcus sp.]|nr:hypothetical protein [Blastococcus sp.]
MTRQPSTASAQPVRTAPPEVRHGHDSSCYWDVDECRWQCVTYPLVGHAPELYTAIGRPVTDVRPEIPAVGGAPSYLDLLHRAQVWGRWPLRTAARSWPA